MRKEGTQLHFGGTATGTSCTWTMARRDTEDSGRTQVLEPEPLGPRWLQSGMVETGTGGEDKGAE